MSKAVNVYLEKRKTRQYVGQLRKEKGKFIFEYSRSYMLNKNPISLGPDLPAMKQKHTSSKIFVTFEDRIPSRQNPAYEDYCKSTGISPKEKNIFVLLTTIGRRGPSSFVFSRPPDEGLFSAEDLKNLRKNLNLSIREFALLFDASPAAVYRIENNKTSGKQVLKRIAVYAQYPKTALEKIKLTGVRIHERKRRFVEKFFQSKQK